MSHPCCKTWLLRKPLAYAPTPFTCQMYMPAGLADPSLFLTSSCASALRSSISMTAFPSCPPQHKQLKIWQVSCLLRADGKPCNASVSRSKHSLEVEAKHCNCRTQLIQSFFPISDNLIYTKEDKKTAKKLYLRAHL